MALEQWRYRDPAEVVDIKRKIEAANVEKEKESKADQALQGLKELFEGPADGTKPKDEH